MIPLSWAYIALICLIVLDYRINDDDDLPVLCIGLILGYGLSCSVQLLLGVGQ